MFGNLKKNHPTCPKENHSKNKKLREIQTSVWSKHAIISEQREEEEEDMNMEEPIIVFVAEDLDEASGHWDVWEPGWDPHDPKWSIIKSDNFYKPSKGKGNLFNESPEIEQMGFEI